MLLVLVYCFPYRPCVVFARALQRDGMVPRDYMSKQGDINENMRAILLDWLIEVSVPGSRVPLEKPWGCLGPEEP